MRLRLLAAAAALCLSTLAAHADTITVYNVSGVFTSGSALSGTLTLDETTGIFTGVNVLVSAPNSTTSFYFPYLLVSQYANAFEPGVYLVALDELGNGDDGGMGLNFGLSSFVGYQGGSIGSVTMPVGNQLSGISRHSGKYDTLQVGSLTVAQTPEPSSIALLGTGLIGLIGVARRKYMSA